MTSPLSSRRPRVLVVTTWMPTSVAPVSGIFVERDLRALATVAHVRVLHLVNPAVDDGVTETKLEGIRIHRMPMDLRNPTHIYAAARMIRRLCRGADLVHTMAVSSLIPMSVLLGAPRPWIHTEHWSGFSATGGLTRMIARAMSPALRRPNVVCAVSPDLAQILSSLGCAHVEVVPNIVQVDGGPWPMPRRAETEKLNVIGVGGLIPRKCPLLTVETCAVLRERGIDCALTWVGEGELADDLRQRAADLAVPLHLAGSLPPAGVHALLRDSDVFVVASRSETFFLGAAEALAAGRPVVVGANGGQRAFVRPPFGEMVESEDPHTLADAVERVVHAARQAQPVDIAGYVRQTYGPEALAQKYQGIYAKLLLACAALVTRGDE